MARPSSRQSLLRRWRAPASPPRLPRESYRASHYQGKPEPTRTIADHQDKLFNRHLKAWHDRPLGQHQARGIIQERTAITDGTGRLRASQKYSKTANMPPMAPCGLRGAVWNHAKDELETPGLPERDPFRSGKLFHKEQSENRHGGCGGLHALVGAHTSPVQSHSPGAAPFYAPVGTAPKTTS